MNKQSWVKDAQQKIKEVSDLPKNWDGYGSSRLSPNAHNDVRTFISHIADMPLPEANVCPVSGGGIQIEWHCEGRELEVDFLGTSRAGCLQSSDPAEPIESECSVVDSEAARRLADWLLKGDVKIDVSDDKLNEKWIESRYYPCSICSADNKHVCSVVPELRGGIIADHNLVLHLKDLARPDLIKSLLEDIADLAGKWGDDGENAESEDFYFAMIGVVESAHLIKGT